MAVRCDNGKSLCGTRARGLPAKGRSRERFAALKESAGVRIAIIERFEDPSRVCDPNSVGSRRDEIRVLHLGSGVALRPPRKRMTAMRLLPRCLRSLGSTIADKKLSIRDKRRLITDALTTGGAPFSALAGLHDALRLLRSDRFDQVVCFSSRDFPLVASLSGLFSIPYRAFLDDSTRYFGEFGFELLAVIPYAYWLQREGRLRLTQASADTRCLYYFSPSHEEFSHPRSYVPISEYPGTRTSRFKWDVHGFPRQLNTEQWIAPPYRSVYRNNTFRWPKKLCIVSNKYTYEPSVWFGRPVNFIPVSILLKIFELLTP